MVNDGSTDGSLETADQFARDYPGKILVISHKGKENRGASASRNLGINHATGDFITFLDSDDIFYPITLETEAAAFIANPEADAVCGTIKYWFSWNGERNFTEKDFTVNLGIETEKLYQPPELLIHNLKASGRKPGMGCVIVRSDFARDHEMFVDGFRHVSEDQLFWTKISLYAKIYVLDQCLAKYRQHSFSSSALLSETGKTANDWKQFLDWLEEYMLENKIENPDVLSGLRLCQRENKYRQKYETLLNLYHRMIPYFLRYRIRDLIIWWRNK